VASGKNEKTKFTGQAVVVMDLSVNSLNYKFFILCIPHLAKIKFNSFNVVHFQNNFITCVKFDTNSLHKTFFC